MTNREFYSAIAGNETLSTEIRDFATAAIGKLDATNEKRRNAQTKAAKENAPFVDYIVNSILGDQPMTATVVTEKINAGLDIKFTVQKVSSLLRAAVSAHRATALDVKIPKKGMQKGYVLAWAEEDEGDATEF